MAHINQIHRHDRGKVSCSPPSAISDVLDRIRNRLKSCCICPCCARTRWAPLWPSFVDSECGPAERPLRLHPIQSRSWPGLRRLEARHCCQRDDQRGSRTGTWWTTSDTCLTMGRWRAVQPDQDDQGQDRAAARLVGFRDRTRMYAMPRLCFVTFLSPLSSIVLPRPPVFQLLV
jgi:hypothetical protein